LTRPDNSEIWQGWCGSAKEGQLYKYQIVRNGDPEFIADPVAFGAEPTSDGIGSSRICSLQHEWHDEDWLQRRLQSDWYRSAISMLQVDLQLEKRNVWDLAEYARGMGFTHIELQPFIAANCLFSPPLPFTHPSALMEFVDVLHAAGLGVILVWPARALTDAGWNLQSPEHRSLLISSACFWADVYHVDALRISGVKTLLAAEPDAVTGFLRQFNEEVYKAHPTIHTIADEAGLPGLVSTPTYAGGLGFGFKWDTAWVRRMRRYFGHDPFFRRHYHSELTGRADYAWSENFVLPLTIEHGVLPEELFGDDLQKRVTLRLLLAYMWALPGKKIVNIEPYLSGMNLLAGELNHLYRSEPALGAFDLSPTSYAWVDTSDAERNILSFLRRSSENRSCVLVVANFAPVVRRNYRCGVPFGGNWAEVLNTNAEVFGGSGEGNFGSTEAFPVPLHGYMFSITLTVPALSVLYLRPQR
jgi:1,4-alpha-glucan branching enzyme